jgi:SAM-dependent methyltransferase
VVVGCGLGGDAEFLARLGFAVVGFDFSAPAIEAARALNPTSTVDYEVADLLALPEGWLAGFDLVVESLTVQSLPRSIRPRVVAAVRSLAAPGGTVLVISSQQGVRPRRRSARGRSAGPTSTRSPATASSWSASNSRRARTACPAGAPSSAGAAHGRR